MILIVSKYNANITSVAARVKNKPSRQESQNTSSHDGVKNNSSPEERRKISDPPRQETESKFIDLIPYMAILVVVIGKILTVILMYCARKKREARAW